MLDKNNVEGLKKVHAALTEKRKNYYDFLQSKVNLIMADKPASNPLDLEYVFRTLQKIDFRTMYGNKLMLLHLKYYIKKRKIYVQ